MKQCRHKGYGIILTKLSVAVSEIQPHKSEVAKSLKACIGGITFVEVFEAITT